MKRSRKEALFIINRSFWPIYPVIGEALLRLAEKTAPRQIVGVILQDRANIHQHLQEQNRGAGVQFFPCRSWTTSSSSILRRILDAVFFMFWVLGVLLMQRPTRVYVSTDPPVLVPFVVMLYCKIFKAKFTYHLQDIHPEAARVVTPVHPCLFKFLRALDGITMRAADALITLSAEMAAEMQTRSATQAPIRLISNPSVDFAPDQTLEKILGFSFCGNAGRLQRIPLLIQAIERYAEQGGKLPFVFAGGGVHAPALTDLAQRCPQVQYKGQLAPKQAAQISATYTWALLPIEDEVTRFAFPSKTSSYVHSGAYIAAICGAQTSVAQWVAGHRLGLCVAPDVDALVAFFFAIERGDISYAALQQDRKDLIASLSFETFLAQLEKTIA